jgi:undecaprenyl-diphosphatase
LSNRLLYTAIAVGTAAFVALAVLARLNQHFEFDPPATLFLQGFRNPPLDEAMVVISWPGYPPQFIIFFTAAAAALVALRRRLELAIMAAAELGVGAVGFALKPLVDRRRPPDSLVWVNDHLTQDPYTFTAGHVHTFMVIVGWIIFLVLSQKLLPPPARVAVVVLGAIFLVVMGISRVYLGDHWSSDVLGAYLLGGIWLGLEVVAYRRLRKSKA